MALAEFQLLSSSSSSELGFVRGMKCRQARDGSNRGLEVQNWRISVEERFCAKGFSLLGLV